MTERIEVAIVMPAYNAAQFIDRSLPAALAAAAGGQVIVIDPGSDDGTAERAEQLGAQVVRLGYRAGPAHARNVGVQHVRAEVALFIDADCVAHPDCVERVRRAFSADASLVSLMGSYDANPPERDFFSQYMNLRHHVTHQRANTEHAGFWAGCGAVRRDLFTRVGGFDAQRYPAPMIEDIELGLRLARLGPCRLDPALQVTHLKRWTLRSVIETDIRCRAMPWSQLILESGKMPNDLNLRTAQRIAAALAPCVLAAPVLLVAASLLALPWLGVVAAALCALSIGLHVQTLRTLWTLRGPVFAACYYLFQQIHLTYSALTFAILSLRHRLRRAPTTDQPNAR